MTATTIAPYALDRGAATTDLWWPYGPEVGRYSFKAGGEQTDGRFAQLLVTEKRGAGTPLHVHRDSDETFFVIEGTLAVVVGDERFDAGPGGFVFAPMGVAHAFLVTSDRAEFLVTVCSAGTAGPEGHGIEGFFREVATAVVPGEAPPLPRSRIPPSSPDGWTSTDRPRRPAAPSLATPRVAASDGWASRRLRWDRRSSHDQGMSRGPVHRPPRPGDASDVAHTPLAIAQWDRAQPRHGIGRSPMKMRLYLLAHPGSGTLGVEVDDLAGGGHITRSSSIVKRLRFAF